MKASALRASSALALAAAIALASPAAAQPRGGATVHDPYEKWNRKSFALSQYLDRHFIRPGALAWKRYVPSGIREGFRNVLSNLGEPVVFINDVLTARADDASTSLKRFIVNSTVGIAGLADVASAWNTPHHDNGFGTTLGRYGVKPGPYVYVPVLGPNDFRDLVGSGVDGVMNPQTWIAYGARPYVGGAEAVIGGLNLRADADGSLESLNATATDPYATLRSLWFQNRAAQVRGEAVDVNALPDFDDPAASGVTAAAPGARSPIGAPPLKTPGDNAPGGDASALPQAASPEGPGPGVGPTDAPPPPSPEPSATTPATPG